MNILELCSGREGWSKYFVNLGHSITTVDINDYGIHYGRFIKSDIYDWEPDQDYDIVLASPPCSEFSKAKYYAYGTQKEHEGLDIVQRVLYLIQKIKPKYWILENVPHLADFIGPPREKIHYGRGAHKWAYLWGNFPNLPMFDSCFNYRSDNYGNSDPRRAEIPEPLARAVVEVLT